MKEIITNLCALLKAQGVEHPENNFKKATSEEKQKFLQLIEKNESPFTDFYLNFQPYEMPTLWNSDVGFLDIEHMVQENSDYAPGAYLSKLGIFAFARTTGGNILAVDTNDVTAGDFSVLIFDHEFCYEDYATHELMINDSFISEEGQKYFGNKPIKFTYENVKRSEIKIEASFLLFLQKLSRDEYDDIETYFPYY